VSIFREKCPNNSPAQDLVAPLDYCRYTVMKAVTLPGYACEAANDVLESSMFILTSFVFVANKLIFSRMAQKQTVWSDGCQIDSIRYKGSLFSP
jgi:hypothetical protein